MSWQLDTGHGLARFQSGGHQFLVDVLRPGRGISQICWNGVTLPEAVLFCISPHPPLESESLEDWYVRGSEMIATYGQIAERTAAPQIVWSVTTQPAELQIDVTIAMQTSLLASDPSVSTHTSFRAAETLYLPDGGGPDDFENAAHASGSFAGLFVHRLHQQVSYVEMIHPADFLPVETHVDSGRLAYRLICESLEKGVIRKARLRGKFVPSNGDLASAWSAYAELIDASPPLKT